jgi:predicted lactoylglutathione lyase
MQRINEGLPLKGRVRFTATDPRTGAIIKIIDNLIVTVGKELIARMLIDESGYDTGLTYCAIGTGSTAPALNQTTLVAEVSRKAITSKTRASNVITLSTFFTAAESAYAIEECGIFGHSTASATVDSGVMFCRALLSYDNSAGNADLTIDWEITIG